MDVWVERELDGCAFPDERLKVRLGKLLADLGQRIGGTVPMACQDWAATKAAYRFFSNPRVDEGVILAGHFAATAARFAATPGTILVLHDTTTYSDVGEAPGHRGIWPAIEEFLAEGHFALRQRLQNNNGLTVLERREPVGMNGTTHCFVST